MKLYEAQEKISKEYVVGAIAFYDKLAPNPWQAAVDQMDAAILSGDFERIEVTADHYCSTICGLITQFKKMNQAPSAMTIRDAFQIAEPRRVAGLQSIRDRACAKCFARGTKEAPLKISQIPNSKEVELLCAQCKKSVQHDT